MHLLENIVYLRGQYLYFFFTFSFKMEISSQDSSMIKLNHSNLLIWKTKNGRDSLLCVDSVLFTVCLMKPMPELYGKS